MLNVFPVRGLCTILVSLWVGRTWRVDRLWLSDKDNLWPTWLLAHICSHYQRKVQKVLSDYTFDRKSHCILAGSDVEACTSQ